MDVKFTTTCPDCGATSPEYDTLQHASMALNRHNCETACKHCKFRTLRRHHRNLCRACYSNVSIRIQYPMNQRKWSETIEELEFLRDQGLGLLDAADRLGQSTQTMHRMLDRCDRLDLYWALADREPDAELRHKASRAGRRAA